MSHFERRKAEVAIDRKLKRANTRSAPSRILTKRDCIYSAQEHKSVSAWKKADHKAWSRADKQGWMNECTAHMPQRAPNGHWKVLENVITEARKYVSRGDWAEHSQVSYNAAHRNGWIDLPEVTGHMFESNAKPAGYWLKPINWPQLLDSARKYDSKAEWEHNESSLASAARKVGGTLYDACTAHMTAGCLSSLDIVYVWAVLEDGERTGVYKAGRTSSELGDYRVVTCAKRNRMEHEIVAWIQTDPGKAPELEAEVLAMGEAVEMPYWIDGYTEFRRFSDSELAEIQNMEANTKAA